MTGADFTLRTSMTVLSGKLSICLGWHGNKLMLCDLQAIDRCFQLSGGRDDNLATEI